MGNEVEKRENAAPDIDISVHINGKLIQRNLSEDLRIEEKHINESLIHLPGITAYWNHMYQTQKSITLRNKVSLEREKAKIDTRIRTMHKNDGTKVTNPEIEASVLLDETYQEIEDQYLLNKETELILKAACEAVKELRSTGISLSANMRSSGDVKINSIEKRYRDKIKKDRE